LAQWCREAGVPASESGAEIQRWRGVLHGLIRFQADGTGTTELLPAADLINSARRAGCARPGEALSYLARDDLRVLRLRTVFHRESRSTLTCYCLGHDMIGLALAAWKLTRVRTESGSPVSPTEAEQFTSSKEQGTALCLSGSLYRAVFFH